MTGFPTLRVARPTNDIAALLPFYCDGLGLVVLGAFTDHEGFDGVMVGAPHAPYHLEFTRKHEGSVGRAPTHEHLLVLYVHERGEWLRAVQRMRDAGFAPVEPGNPYWARQGATFEDPEGYRVVLQCAQWEADGE